jgi:xanthine dehydrogenase accessory factor
MKVWAQILAAVEAHGCCALVSVVKTEGSAPRDAGARMVVTPEGYHGTIGGGTLEWRAIALAQAQVVAGAAVKLSNHALGPELGQCCGGRVQLAIESFDRSALSTIQELANREAEGPFSIRGRIQGLDVVETFGERPRRLYLYGAGHVGRALVLAVAPLPFEVIWIDPRPAAFPRAVPGNVTLIEALHPVSELKNATDGSFVFIMSHSHALDLAITDAALRNPRIAHVGLIGSATKRSRFEKRLREASVAEDRIASLICPIGLPDIESKEPAVIAAATAAQLLVLDEKLKADIDRTHHHRDSADLEQGARA